MYNTIKDTTFEELLQKIPKYPMNWKSEDVTLWLTHIGMQSYSDNFKEMSVDGLLILELTDEDLETELKITKKLHRKKISKAIGQLHQYNEFLQEEARRETKMISEIERINSKENEPVIKEDEILTTDHNNGHNPENRLGGDSDSFINDDDEEIIVEEIHEGVKEEKSKTDPVLPENKSQGTNFIVIKSIEGPSDINYKVGEEGTDIGRHSTNKIVIFDESVSRYHAQVTYRDSNFYLVDIGSTTGTFVKITEPLELKEEMIIEIGSYQFMIKKVTISPDEAFEARRENSYVEFFIYEAPEDIEDKKFKLIDNDSIGRKNTSTLSFNDDLHMSNLHCKIILMNDRFLLEDIASTNGTWLRLSEESLESQEVILTHQMIFKIGNSAMYEIDMGEKPPTQIDEHKEKNNNTCSICWDEERDCLIMPCRHNVTCLKCIKSVKNCPICRKPIQDLLRIFKG